MTDLARIQALATKLGAAPAARSTDGPQLADMMDEYEERAAILQYESNMPRLEAERMAWSEVMMDGHDRRLR